MNIRENLEQLETEYLSPYAAHSRDSKGRPRPEEQCDIRPVFQRDRDRICAHIREGTHGVTDHSIHQTDHGNDCSHTNDHSKHGQKRAHPIAF